MASNLVAVNVILDAEARSLLRTTLARLRNAGLQDALVIDGLGIVSGRIAADKLPALKRVIGVRVEKDETVPPGAPDATPPPPHHRRTER